MVLFFLRGNKRRHNNNYKEVDDDDSVSPPSSAYSSDDEYIAPVSRMIPRTKTQRHLKENMASEPDTDYYSSNHVLVNQARQSHGLQTLTRSKALDNMARFHASSMAKQGLCFHSVVSLKTLQEKLMAEEVGENIQRGSSIKSMHMTTMCNDHINRYNILSRHFTEFGMGTAKGSDGKLYMVQLFRGPKQ